MVIIGIIILAAASALGILIYRYVKRTAAVYGMPVEKKWAKIVLIAATVGIVLLIADYTALPSGFFWHFLGMAFLTELADFIIRKCSKENYQTKFRKWHWLVSHGLIPLFATAIIVTYGYINMFNVVETRYEFTTDKEVRDEGWKVIMLSDVHYGVSLGKNGLQKKCDEISTKNADVVILCGDIVDNDTKPEKVEEAFAAFGSIRTKQGVYFVYGNHDRSTEELTSDYSDEFLVDTIEKNGITILQDETLALDGGLTMIGREDYYQKKFGRERKPLSELLKDADRDTYLMVLDHQPRDYAENVQEQTDLILSGHTHAGQLFPGRLVEEIFGMCDGVFGLYEPGGRTKAIVSAGFGGWTYPIRTECHSEYVTVEIKGK